MHIITIAFACSQIKLCQFNYLLSEHASFFIISKVLIIYFTRISKQMHVLFVVARLWGNGMQSDLALQQQRKNNTTWKG